MRLHYSDKGRAVTSYRRKDIPMQITFCRFKDNQYYTISSNKEEKVLILLSGIIERADRLSVRLQRSDVFMDTPSAIYVGPGEKIRIVACSSGEFVLVGHPACGEGVVEIITDAERERRGKEGYMRTVYNIIDESFPAKHLIIGETINDAGNWSSFPPHKHDVNTLEEVRLAEVYFFKVKPENGFGFQRIYDNDGLDKTFTINNNDVVWIPRGYHPVTVMPRHQLYYLWALAGDARQLRPKTEDKFNWLL